MLLIMKKRSQRNILNKIVPNIKPCGIADKISCLTYFSSLFPIKKVGVH